MPDPMTILAAAGMALEGGQLLYDIFTTDEQEELAALYRSGKLDPQTEKMIGQMVNRQFGGQRQAMGADLARRGLMDSSVTGRRMTESYNDQYRALAETITSEALRRQGLGFQMQAQLDAEEQASAANLFGMAGSLMEYRANEAHNAQLLEEAKRGRVNQEHMMKNLIQRGYVENAHSLNRTQGPIVSLRNTAPSKRMGPKYVVGANPTRGKSAKGPSMRIDHNSRNSTNTNTRRRTR